MITEEIGLMPDIRTRSRLKVGIAWRAIAAGVVALSMATAAHASPILSLFNTGVFAGGAVVPDGTTGDLHYTLVSAPGGTTVLRARALIGGYPIPPWLGDDSLSRWIGPNNDSALDGPPGTYDYQTTFDLTGFNPLTASLSVKWAMDNSGVDVLLNGVPTGHAASAPGYAAFTPFTINTGFVAGLNTLDFLVLNFNDVSTPENPTGLRVELAGTADALPTPEPASFLLFGAGLVGLSMIPRRRTRVAKSK